MKTKLRFIILLILSMAVVILNAADFSAPPTDTSSIRFAHLRMLYAGKLQDVDWFATTNILSRQPRWDGVSSNAPLSMSNAVLIALSKVKSLHTDIHDWVVSDVSIKNLSDDEKFKDLICCSNVCYYNITINPKDDEKWVELVDAGKSSDFHQVVLMDGTLIEPVKAAVNKATSEGGFHPIQ